MTLVDRSGDDIGERQRGSSIEGLVIGQLDTFADERGSFTEIWCEHWGTGVEPTQWSLVQSARRSLRGMHLHRRHDEYFLLVQGHVTIGLYDLRDDSPTVGAWATVELKGPQQFVAFPRGLVHGWLFHEPSTHLQAVSESYVHYGTDDNNGCRWDDPDLGIEWPFRPVALSPRAEDFGTLAQLRDTYPSTATG